MKKYTVKLIDGTTGTVPLRYYPRASQSVTINTETGKVTGKIAEVLRVR
jgi:hypothetical protein